MKRSSSRTVLRLDSGMYIGREGDAEKIFPKSGSADTVYNAYMRGGADTSKAKETCGSNGSAGSKTHAERGLDMIEINKIEFEWVTVPAENFLMGTPSDQSLRIASKYDSKYFLSESPQRKVFLDAFMISAYPVTNRQY